MKKINIKPLSANDGWQGKRFKTNDYKNYEKELWYLLDNENIPQGKLRLDLEFGFSNKGSDIDNPIKFFIDICSKKYIFNDNMIYELNVKKKIVEKGKEYIKYKFYAYES